MMNRLINKLSETKIQSTLALFILASVAVVPQPVLDTLTEAKDTSVAILAETEYIQAPERSIVTLSEEDAQKRREEMRELGEGVSELIIQASAYTAREAETDDKPYSNAIGAQARDWTLASNYFPIDSYIEFPDIFPGKLIRVEDRMNTRYTRDFKLGDVFVGDDTARRIYEMNNLEYPITVDSTPQERADARLKAAKMFGRRNLRVVVHKWGNNCRGCR